MELKLFHHSQSFWYANENVEQDALSGIVPLRDLTSFKTSKEAFFLQWKDHLWGSNCIYDTFPEIDVPQNNDMQFRLVYFVSYN